MRPNVAARPPELRQLEIAEYITAFKLSSDGVRYLIYVTTIISVLIFICTWNVSPWSWSRQRLDRADKIKASFEEEFAKSHPPPPNAQATRLKDLSNWYKAKDAYVEQHVRDDYATRFRNSTLKDLMFIEIPLLGIHIDVNDIGLVGGVILTTLAMLLTFTMVRQHENLCLAFFKLRRLCETERLAHHDGESMANFFYHSLAMGQVLNYPPTLARWGYGFRNRLAGLARWGVFLLPALVHLFVVWGNLATFSVAQGTWGSLAFWRMTAQIILLITVSSFCVLSALYSRAANLRWRDAFVLINPGLAEVQQRPWLEWLRLTKRKRGLGAIMTELIYSLRPDGTGEETEMTTVAFDAEVPLPTGHAPRIDESILRAMAREVQMKALANAGGKRPFAYETVKNSIEDGHWVITIRCRYQ